MALTAATWTGDIIVTVVSRFSGLANDAASRAAVLQMVNLGLDEISLQTPWDWLSTTASDITVVAGTADYALPTASGSEFDEVYDARLVGSAERTLDYIDRRTLDKVVRGKQSNTSTPTHYYIYGPQKNATISLFPTPNAGDTLRMRYFTRQPHITDSSGSSLAIPDKYMPLVIFKGAENCAAWKRPEQVATWAAKYSNALARALDINRNKPDEIPTFSPKTEHSGSRTNWDNPDDLLAYPR